MSEVSSKPLRILVVDDETFILGVVVKLLEKLGYTNVTTAMDGSSALVKLVTSSPPFDLIISDLNMPKMDGVEFLRRTHETAFSGGVILLSAEGIPMLESAFQFGTSHQLNVLGAIPKPVNADALNKLIEDFILSRSRRKVIRSVSLIDLEELKSGLRRPSSNLLQLFYQPVVDLTTNRISRIEALLRWNNPAQGLLFPNSVLPVAEQGGMLLELTKLVIDRALTELAAWLHPEKSRCVSINLPAGLVNDVEFIDTLVRMTNQYKIEPGQLLMEVPAAELLADKQELQEAVMRLRMKRFNISLSDFGSGSYSLSTLKRFPIAEIKIDNPFVGGAVDNRGARAILEACAAIGKNLNVKTVAQCAEKEEDVALAKDCGIDCAQGFFLARPMPRDPLMIFLQSN